MIHGKLMENLWIVLVKAGKPRKVRVFRTSHSELYIHTIKVSFICSKLKKNFNYVMVL